MDTTIYFFQDFSKMLLLREAIEQKIYLQKQINT